MVHMGDDGHVADVPLAVHQAADLVDSKLHLKELRQSMKTHHAAGLVTLEGGNA